MLERQTRPAQGLIEYPLRHPQHQSREAGSCLGAIRPFEVLRRNFDDPPYGVILWQSGEQPKSTHTGPAEPASEERDVTITQSRGSLGLNRPFVMNYRAPAEHVPSGRVRTVCVQ